jgi:hypothetical protein
MWEGGEAEGKWGKWERREHIERSGVKKEWKEKERKE